LDAKVLRRHQHCTEVEVKARYERHTCTVRTEIGEGNDIPNTTLVGFTTRPAVDFVVALHEALHAQTDIAATEIRRICAYRLSCHRKLGYHYQELLMAA